MKYFVAQPSENTCGIACLKTYLSLVSKDINFRSLSYPKPIDQSYNLKELIDIAKEYGFKLQGIEFDNIKDITGPIILLSKGKTHAVTVVPLKLGLYKIYDPNIGIIYKNKKYIEKSFSNVALVCEHYEIKDMDDAPYSYPKPNTLEFSNIHYEFCCIIHILSFIFAITSFYFINSNSYFIFPVIFMVMSIIMSLLSKNIALNSLKKLDLYMIENHSNLKECYESYSIYKKYLFTNKLQFVSSIIVILFTFLIGAITQVDSLPTLGVSFLIGVIEFLFLTNKDKIRLNNINKIENAYLKNKDIKNEYLLDGIEETYKFAKSISFRKIVEIFLIFSTVLLTSAIIKLASLNYIIFYVFIGMFLLEHTQHLFEFQDNHIKFLKAKEHIEATYKHNI